MRLIEQLLNEVSNMEFYANFQDGIISTECFDSKTECNVTINTNIDENENDGFICIPIYDLKRFEVFETENTHTRIYINKCSIEFHVVKI